MKPTMTRETMEIYDYSKVQFIKGVDHNESLSVGPNGEAYTAGFHSGRVFRLNLDTNMGELIGENAGRPVLGQVVDADGNIYCCEPQGPQCAVSRITPQGERSIYSHGPKDGEFLSCNTPAFDKDGNMYLSDTGTWSSAIDGHIYKIRPGGGDAELWFPHAVDTPNGIAIDAEEKYLYFVETWGNSIARIEIKPDGSAGEFERVLHLPRNIPDGLCFDEDGRLWIACDRPDIIWVFDLNSRRLEIFLEDWQGGGVRGACHLAFAGPQRDVLLASCVNRPRVHRYDNPGAKGLRLNNPKI